jgi:hypothetical protein
MKQRKRIRRPAPRRWTLQIAVVLLPLCQHALGGDFTDNSFLFSHEFHGANAFTDPAAEANLKARMANALTLWPPITPALVKYILAHQVGLIAPIYGDPSVAALSPADLDSNRKAVAALTASLGWKAMWSAMPEWDQAGGKWVPKGRPRYVGLTRAQAYAKFIAKYFHTSSPLGAYAAQTRAQRGCTLAAVTDYAVNTFYAYANGVDICLLERAIDELSDISTGIAFVRGAARQYDRRWGIDISNWRTANDSATQFNSDGLLTGGWSASYLKRHFYIAYMSGAHVLQNEAAVYYAAKGVLNPLGEATREFADFALKRHRDIGHPAVTTALMIDDDSGFDAKHGVYNQSSAVWYQDIGYSSGDHMIDNFLKVAYPGHWLHGTTPSAPFLNAKGAPDATRFRQYLAAGGDPRPYEPMSTTRWGDNLDILTTAARLATFKQYRVIALIGSVNITARLRADLKDWVQAGGVLVMNIDQIGPPDDPLTGVKVLAGSRGGAKSKWLPEGQTVTEPPFTYRRVAPVTATVLATAGDTDPLVTLNKVGQGEVILTTPHYLQSNARDRLLTIGTTLFDWLELRFATATVHGAPIEYIVNQASRGALVTLVNNSAKPWNGSIGLAAPAAAFSVREYVTDTIAAYSRSGEAVSIVANVPAYDVRVYAAEISSDRKSTSKRSKPAPPGSRKRAR